MELHNVNNLKCKELKPFLHPVSYMTPNTEFGSFPLGRGLAKALRFSQPPLIPRGRAQEIPQGIDSRLTLLLHFPPVTVRWVSLGTLGCRAARHHYAPKSNKGSSVGFKGRGTHGPGWGGLTKSEEKSGSSNFSWQLLLGLKKQLSHGAVIWSEGKPIALAATGHSIVKEVITLKINHSELQQQPGDAKLRCKTCCYLPDWRLITVTSAISSHLQDPSSPIKLQFFPSEKKQVVSAGSIFASSLDALISPWRDTLTSADGHFEQC